jgi:hypothetical protein
MRAWCGAQERRDALHDDRSPRSAQAPVRPAKLPLIELDETEPLQRVLDDAVLNAGAIAAAAAIAARVPPAAPALTGVVSCLRSAQLRSAALPRRLAARGKWRGPPH